MKKFKLKNWVKIVLLGVVFGLILMNIGVSLNSVSLDELGNTCYGTIIKVCGGE